MKPLKITKSMTTFTDKTFSKYLDEVSKIPQIDVEAEVELGKRIAQGDESAVNELVRANLRFVISVANQYKKQSLSLEDLVTEGNIGLVNAAKTYDHSRGFKFISYAVYHIRKQMIEYSNNNSRVVRLPTNKINSLNKLRESRDFLTQQLEREPTVEELMDHCDDTSIRPEVAMSLLEMANERHKSTDEPMYEDGTETYANTLECNDFKADDGMDQKDLKFIFEKLFNRLTKFEIAVIKHTYGMDGYDCLTNTSIAHLYDVSAENVRITAKKALKKLLVASKYGETLNIKMYL